VDAGLEQDGKNTWKKTGLPSIAPELVRRGLRDLNNNNNNTFYLEAPFKSPKVTLSSSWHCGVQGWDW